MIYWIVDHTFAVYVVLILVGLGFFLSWRQQRGARSRWGMFGVVAAGALVWVLALTVTTDRQRLRQSLEEMADAALKGDAAKLRALFAPNFSLQGKDAKFVSERAGPTARGQTIRAVHLFQFQFEELSRSEGKAQVRFGARVELRDHEFLVRCLAQFDLVGERWLLRTIDIFPPLVNQNQPIQIPWDSAP